MNDLTTDSNTWAANLNPVAIQLWREAIAHLRHLSDEVWNRFKLFLAIDGAILGFMFVTVVFSAPSGGARLLLWILALAGFAVTLVARYILKRNRVYYLQMLAKKSLLEDELGFYNVRFSGTDTDLVFPWRLAPEAVKEIKKSATQWVESQVRGKGTIAQWLFLIFEVLAGFYCLIVAALFFSLLRF